MSRMDENKNIEKGFARVVEESCVWGDDGLGQARKVVGAMCGASTLAKVGDMVARNGTVHIDYPSFDEIGVESIASCRLSVARELVWRESMLDVEWRKAFVKLTTVASDDGITSALSCCLRGLAAKNIAKELLNNARLPQFRTLLVRSWQVAKHYGFRDELLSHVTGSVQRDFAETTFAKLDRLQIEWSAFDSSSDCKTISDAAFTVLFLGVKLGWKEIDDLFQRFELSPKLMCILYGIRGIQLSVVGQDLESIHSLEKATIVKNDEQVLEFCRQVVSIQLDSSVMKTTLSTSGRNLESYDEDTQLLVATTALEFNSVVTEGYSSLALAKQDVLNRARIITKDRTMRPWFVINIVSRALCSFHRDEEGILTGWNVRGFVTQPRLEKLNDLEDKLYELTVSGADNERFFSEVTEFCAMKETRTAGILEVELRKYKQGERLNDIAERLHAELLMEPDMFYVFHIAELLLKVESEIAK